MSNFTQDYYECYNSVLTSVQVAFGSASGTAGTVSPLFLLLFVSLFSNFFTSKKPKKEVSSAGEAGEIAAVAEGVGGGQEVAGVSTDLPPPAPDAKKGAWSFFKKKVPAAAPAAAEGKEDEGGLSMISMGDVESGDEYVEVEGEEEEEEEEERGR